MDQGVIISAFQFGYVVMVLITGWLADMVGPKKIVALATLLCAITATLFPFVERLHDHANHEAADWYFRRSNLCTRDGLGF